MSTLIYKCVLLKILGEALAGDLGFKIDVGAVDRICLDIAEASSKGIEIGVVVL